MSDIGAVRAEITELSGELVGAMDKVRDVGELVGRALPERVASVTAGSSRPEAQWVSGHLDTASDGLMLAMESLAAAHTALLVLLDS